MKCVKPLSGMYSQPKGVSCSTRPYRGGLYIYKTPPCIRSLSSDQLVHHVITGFLDMFFLLLCAFFVRSSIAAVIISEISDKGTSNACPDKQDWVEIHNTGSSAIDLAGFKLHDNNGPNASKAYVFPADSKVLASAFLVLCTRVKGNNTLPKFKIGGDDTITLRNPSGGIVSTSGNLQNSGEYDLTWAYNSNTKKFAYTSTPTPGKPNVFTEIWPSIRARLTEQHIDGEAFFESTSIDAARHLPPVVELHVTMSTQDFAYQKANASYEVYTPFTQLKITSYNGARTHAELSGGGQMRPRGQSTLATPFCMGYKTIPWLIDITGGADKTQRLFGMEKFYLRNHYDDPSYLREWTMHRMLRRFGLPYLRTRTVKLFINDEYTGLYLLMEAPDQDYVFYRNFGVENKNAASTKPPFAAGHAMYKVKVQSIRCGEQNYKELGISQSVVSTAPKNPKMYAFKRGSHRPRLPVLRNQDQCGAYYFIHQMNREFGDAMASWEKKGRNCGKMVVDNGLVDRDIGTSNADTDNNDARMESFFNDYLSGPAWKGCRSSKNGCDSQTGIYAALRNTPKVDVDQWLKNFAVYAVTLGLDSPIGDGNNYFLATPGGATEAQRAYRLVQYDHNNVATPSGSNLCSPECSSRGIYWSIARPTCRALADNPHVGPLLAGKGNEGNMKRYLSYVKDFNADVYTNADLIAETEAHASAIASAVKTDPGRPVSGVQQFEKELKASNGQWQEYNLLAFMKARGEEVKKQLDALDAGTFPHHDDQVEACQDWRSKTARSSTYQEDGKKCDKHYRSCSLSVTPFCFDETSWCNAKTGQFTTVKCKEAIPCRNCYPYSMCGSKGNALRAFTKNMTTASPTGAVIDTTAANGKTTADTALSGSVQEEADGSDSLPEWIIAVIVGGILLVLAGVGAVVVYFVLSKMQRKTEAEQSRRKATVVMLSQDESR